MTEHFDDIGTVVPADILKEIIPSHGNVRNFLEHVALAPLNDSAQRAAGDAAARNALSALSEMYQIADTDLVTGFRSVTGAEAAAGGARTLSQPDPAVDPDAGAAAFFDVDNTLIQGASIFLFALGLVEHGFVRRRDLVGMLWKQMKFRISGSENAADVAKAREQALEFFQGHSVAEMVELAEKIFDDKIDERIYHDTSELAQLHLHAGQEVWLVTATPVQLAQVIARRMGFTGALGTVAEVEDGKFTGRLVGDILHGPGKKHAVAALAASSGLDLRRCTAYSDSANDIPMLSMVGTAIAINPDWRLRRHALQQEWEVHDHRHVRTATISAVRGLLAAGAVGGVAVSVAGVARWLYRRSTGEGAAQSR